jgi:hypothetical protein
MKMKNTYRAALAAVVVAGGLALAAPGFAGGEPKMKKVIVITDREGGSGGEATSRIRTMHLDGEHGTSECSGERSGISEETGTGDARQKTRIMICGDGSLTAAQRAAKLAEVRARIAGEADLSAEHKAKVTAALDAEIARLRAGN